MRSVYAIKLNVAKYGKRPTSSTPVEPLLVQLNNGEILAMCLFEETLKPDALEEAASVLNGEAARPVVEIPIDLSSNVKLEVRPNGTHHECILTITA